MNKTNKKTPQKQKAKQKQKNIFDDRSVKSTVPQPERKSFNWKIHCLFCLEVCAVDTKHPNCSKVDAKLVPYLFQPLS